MKQLFDNQELLYIIICILIAILIILLTLIVRLKPKRKVLNSQPESPLEPIEAIETDDDFEPKIDIEQVLGQMQKDIEEQKITEIKSFEDEQEEKSIISYQELLEKSKQEVTNNDIIEEEPVTTIDDIEIEQPTRRFRNTEFISPIFGRLDNDITYPTIPNFKSIPAEEKNKLVEINDELEKTLDVKPLHEEIKKNDEFLKMLKEFRKSLE